MGGIKNGFSEAKKVPQYVAAISVSIGAIIFGTILGWTAQISDDLQYGSMYDFPISEDELGWIGSSAALGGLFFCIPSGYLCDSLGRKKAMLILTVPCAVGWSLIIWADSVWMVVGGRFLTGVTGGAFSVTIPLYITEIATKDIRGILGTYFQIMINVGVLFAYIFGAVLSPFHYNLSCLLPVALFFCVFVCQPESPVFLLMKNRADDARDSLTRLRGITYNVNGELDDIQTYLNEQRKCKVCLREALRKPEVRKSFVIAAGLVFFFQFSGVNTIIFYASDIFIAANIEIEPEISTIIVGNTMVLATFLASFVMDRFGRKTLLITSGFVMALCCFLLGMFFTMKERELIDSNTTAGFNSLPIFAVCLFIIFYSFGFGPITWIVGPEVSLPELRGKVVSVAGTLNWILTFLVTKFFFSIKTSVGIDVLFYIFGITSIVGIVFVFFVVVETKGKSVEQIQLELKNEVRPKRIKVGRTGIENIAYVTDV